MSDSTPRHGAGDHDPLAAAEGLTSALEDVRDELRSLRGELKSVREASETRDAHLAEDAKRSRRIITALAVSFCLDLLITAGFGYNTVRVNETQNASHANQVAACRQANVNRAEDVAIWNQFLTDLAPPAARTAKVRAELAGIYRLIRIKDKPRNCTAVYRLSSGTGG